jgi:hypothetical protein
MIMLDNLILMRLVRFSWKAVAEAGRYAKKNLGLMLREAGLDLDRRGSIL